MENLFIFAGIYSISFGALMGDSDCVFGGFL